MLEIVNKRAAEEGIKNIETVQMRWEDVDLDKLGWRGRFRLAIASMTPGIHDVVTLRKMNEASNCGCYYSGFTQRTDAAQEDLWRLFYNEPMPALPADVFCVFHLLHAWGYCPSIELSRENSQRQYALEEAVEELGLLMIPYIEQTEESHENNRTVCAVRRPRRKIYPQALFCGGKNALVGRALIRAGGICSGNIIPSFGLSCGRPSCSCLPQLPGAVSPTDSRCRLRLHAADFKPFSGAPREIVYGPYSLNVTDTSAVVAWEEKSWTETPRHVAVKVTGAVSGNGVYLPGKRRFAGRPLEDRAR